ncbi:hypothetical protein GCM10010145_01210 [Streptomyces ruber]|uniref:Uncharacterized protein n=2 Tax=Streptomyces TaxID=1883 RepID=A0A918B6J5_9ACTN|nr:hypothetical protein [Streptomyces ruber]GGQ37798.1 hypothetical protein GCM10010145_01210 [Streptomyces ruber]
MRTTRRVTTALTGAALLAVTAVLGAPPAAARNPLPLPVSGTYVETLVGEGVTVEGPLINNITLPTLR